MAEAHANCRLAAILSADVVGFSRLMGVDEAATLSALKRHRKSVFDPSVADHGGRIVKLIGDGTLVEFMSVVAAVECALAIQMAVLAEAVTEGPAIVLRIGINLGDVIADGDDIYGDGVNIAARLEPLAEPGGVCVASIVNESVRGRIDVAFVDAGEVRVKDIDRPIRIWKWHPSKGEALSAPVTVADKPRAPEKPSIAVLPFDNMSGDPEQEYFSDGIAEDLITDLSKIGELTVIARNSSFSYKGRSVDLRTIGRELGAKIVLEGSVRRAGQRVRITAQLIDTSTGGHLWAERYDRDLTDIFAVQDDVTQRIVEALKIKLTPREMSMISGAGTKNIEAHNCYLRARELLATPNMNREVFEQILEFGNRAIELDPDYAQAYAGLSLTWVFDYHNRWSDDPDGALQRAAELAAKAVEVDPNEPMAHFAVSIPAGFLQETQRAAEAIEKTLALNPNYAPAFNSRAIFAIYAGRPQDAIADIERAKQLDPGFNHHYFHFIGLAHFMLGNLETAETMFRERIVLFPGTDASRAMLASVLGHLGWAEDAKQVWDDLMEVNPRYSFEQHMARLPFDDPSGVEKITEGLAKAGLP